MVLHAILHYLALSCTILHYLALSCFNLQWYPVVPIRYTCSQQISPVIAFDIAVVAQKAYVQYWGPVWSEKYLNTNWVNGVTWPSFAHLDPEIGLFEVWELMPLAMMMFCRMLISPGVIRVKNWGSRILGYDGWVAVPSPPHFGRNMQTSFWPLRQGLETICPLTTSVMQIPSSKQIQELLSEVLVDIRWTSISSQATFS